MAIDRAEHVHETFLNCLAKGRFPARKSALRVGDAGLSNADLAQNMAKLLNWALTDLMHEIEVEKIDFERPNND